MFSKRFVQHIKGTLGTNYIIDHNLDWRAIYRGWGHTIRTASLIENSLQGTGLGYRMLLQKTTGDNCIVEYLELSGGSIRYINISGENQAHGRQLQLIETIGQKWYRAWLGGDNLVVEGRNQGDDLELRLLSVFSCPSVCPGSRYGFNASGTGFGLVQFILKCCLAVSSSLSGSSRLVPLMALLPIHGRS